MTKTTRIRLLLLLNILAVILLIGTTWISRAHRPYFMTVPRVTPDPVALLDPDAVSFCRDVQVDLAAGRYARLDGTAADLRTLKEHVKGGIEKLVAFYVSLASPDCRSAPRCDDDVLYPPRLRAMQDWLNRAPHDITAHVAMAHAWEAYAWAGRHCHKFKDVTFDEWQAFYDRVRISRSYLAGADPAAEPMAYLLRLEHLRDSGASRAEIDALYSASHNASPRFFALIALYATMLDPSWYGKEGDLGWLAESVLNNPGGEDGQIAYAMVANAESGQIPYPHLFLETGLTWPRTKAGLTLIEKRYGNSNRDWNVDCYMALVAIDRPAALEYYRHFGQNWDPAIWNNADYFYGQALPWITYGQ